MGVRRQPGRVSGNGQDQESNVSGAVESHSLRIIRTGACSGSFELQLESGRQPVSAAMRITSHACARLIIRWRLARSISPHTRRSSGVIRISVATGCGSAPFTAVHGLTPHGCCHVNQDAPARLLCEQVWRRQGQISARRQP
jgi:hypothetical protein